MTHIKAFYRKVNGRVVYVSDHDDKRTTATLHQAASTRTPKAHPPKALRHGITPGSHRDGSHFLRAGSREGAEAIQEAARKHGISLSHRKSPAIHQGQRDVFSHFHHADLKAIKAVHTELQTQQIQKDSNEVFGDQEKARKAYEAHPESKGGKKIDVDEARELVPSYRENRTLGAAIVHADASKFAKEQFEHRMAMPKQERNEVVAFMAGGGGSGKGTAADKFQLEDAAHTIVDGAFSNFEKAKAQIERARASKRRVEINFVYRPIEKAVAGMVGRAHGTGRIVPLDVLAEAHRGAHETIRKLIEHYGESNPMVRIRIFDNSGDSIHDVTAVPRQDMLKFLDKTAYDDTIADRVAGAYREVREKGYEHKGQRHQTESRITDHLDRGLRALDGRGIRHPHGAATGHPSGDEGGNQARRPRDEGELDPKKPGRGIAKALREIFKAHIKGHIRVIDGKTVWIAAHEDKRQGREARLHERTVRGETRGGLHYLRASDADDAATIRKVAHRAGIFPVEQKGNANHLGREGNYTHFHFQFPGQAEAVHQALRDQQEAPEPIQAGLFDEVPEQIGGPTEMVPAERAVAEPKEDGPKDRAPHCMYPSLVDDVQREKIEQWHRDGADPARRPAERAIYLPGMSKGKLDRLLQKNTMTLDEIEGLKDYKYLILAQPNDAWEMGFMTRYASDHGDVLAPKNKFLLTNIDAKLEGVSNPPQEGPKEGDRNEERLVFHDGRWHRDNPAPSDPPSVETDTGAPEPVPAPPASDPIALETRRALLERIDQGTITPAELVQAWEAFQVAKPGLKAELDGLSKAKCIERIRPLGFNVDPKTKMTKDSIIKAVLDRMTKPFNVQGVMSWSPFSETYEAALDRVVRATTPEQIATHAAEVAQAKENRKAALEKIQKAIENPETLEDFELRAKQEAPDLTAEQRRRWEELKADAQRQATGAKAPTPAASMDGLDLELHDTKHTKTGETLHVVTISQRVDRSIYEQLLAKAKGLGGWYSSYRGNGAIPGFTFKTPEAAKAFMGQTSEEGAIAPVPAAEERQAVRQEKVSSKLRDMAEKMKEQAEGSLVQDRRTGTHRQARMAASAEAVAHGQIAMANTMTNLAAAIEEGKAKHLAGLTTRTQIETLNSILSQAIREHQRAQGLSYAQKQAEEGRAANQEDVDHAEYPYPEIWDHIFGNITREATHVPGTKRALARLATALHGKEHIKLDTPDLIEAGTTLAQKIGNTSIGKRLKDLLTRYTRLQAARIQSPEQLRAALREYLVYKSMAPGADPIKTAERSLIGAKIPGYFPTPSALAQEVVDKADIAPGMKILEPSAGKGSLIDAIHEAYGKDAVEVEAIEPVSSLRTILEAKGHKLVGRDIMEHEALEGYDRVVMNPPFENGQDMEHVRKAFELLKPGGRLVAITSPAPFFHQSKKAQAFREWFDSLGGVQEKNPDGSFKASDNPTGVATHTLIIDKPAA